MNYNVPKVKDAKDLKWPEDFLNIKCVIYSVYIALLYWLLPRTKFFLFAAFLLNYFSINWYNYMYLCEYNSFIGNISYSVIILLLLLFVPIKNKVILGFSLYLPYFLIAWYDYFANCAYRMNPTIFPFGRFIYLPIKPDPYQRRYDELDPAVKKNIAAFDKYGYLTIIIGIVMYFLNKFVL